MKKLLLLSSIVLFSNLLYSQTIDTSEIILDTTQFYLITETIEDIDDTTEIYQYRITLNQSYDGFNETFLVQSMTDFFETKVEYSRDLNQFILISTKDVDQSNFARNFHQEIVKYKKIQLKANIN